MAPPGVYDGLRVVELGSDPGTEFVGRLLSRLGADVVKVETLGVRGSRDQAPFDEENESLHFSYYNAGKRSFLLEDSGVPAALDRLLRATDVFLLGLHPDELVHLALDPHQLSERHRQLIVVAITPFGLDGPWARYRSSDLVALAAGGILNNCGYDDRAIPPIRPAGNQAYHLAASHALMALLLALIERSHTQRGQLLDVSMHAVLAVNTEMASLYWSYAGALVRRQTGRNAMPMDTAPTLMRCADGRYIYFMLILAESKTWTALVDWLSAEGLVVDLDDSAYSDVEYRQEHFSHIYEVLEAFCLLYDAESLYLEGQARGLAIGIVNAPEDLLVDEHLSDRGFFRMAPQLGGRAALIPGPPFTFSTWPLVRDGRPPERGEHNAELMDETTGTGA